MTSRAISTRPPSALGVLTSTRGLVVVVMLNSGRDLGIIGPTLFTMFIADELCAAPTPERAHSIIERIESLW